MACTVFAEKLGWFHQSSGGTGTAPGDVCLSPPPPPTGPVPVPYVNMLFASDLTKGSKSVKADGSPTALENSSEIATSTGNEAGTQGGGVVTHVTKGKGSFSLWSFTVKVEGKGVCRHTDPILQNESCTPPNCTAPGARTLLENKLIELGIEPGTPCPKPYESEKHRPGITQAQEDEVYGKKCWECAKQIRAGKKPKTPGGKWMRKSGYEARYGRRRRKIYKNRDRKRMTPDHQPPLNRAWELGGCHLKTAGFKELMSQPEMVRPHCRAHSNSQGTKVKAAADALRASRGG
ncbi:MAG: DUF4150 domain-containing protein [Rhizobiaceae bacterium]|nr:DUF4150 domain-containing protein [Rhizobiaceae bacterium]